jgi:predicted RNase H-like HicB family nuclease
MKRRGVKRHLRNEFTAIIERDGEWFIAYCPEIPGANGQGKTKAEARQSLAEAIALILEQERSEIYICDLAVAEAHRREDVLRFDIAVR